MWPRFRKTRPECPFCVHALERFDRTLSWRCANLARLLARRATSVRLGRRCSTKGCDGKREERNGSGRFGGTENRIELLRKISQLDWRPPRQCSERPICLKNQALGISDMPACPTLFQLVLGSWTACFWKCKSNTTKNKTRARKARAIVVCSLSCTLLLRFGRPYSPNRIIHLARGCIARIVSGRGANPLATASALCSFVSRAIF